MLGLITCVPKEIKAFILNQMIPSFIEAVFYLGHNSELRDEIVVVVAFKNYETA